MPKARLYIGLVKESNWYNYAEIHPIGGGSLSILDTGDKTGAARFLKLVKGSVDVLYTESGEAWELKEDDYLNIYSEDAWKISYEAIKIRTGKEHPVIPENFYCSVCSKGDIQNYTPVSESWQKLVDEGYIDEFYADSQECEFKVVLPKNVIIDSGRTVVGGEFNEMIMKPLTLRQMLELHKNRFAISTEANIIYASWDAMIVKIPGISDRDLNTLKRTPDSFFTKKYITDDDNLDAIAIAVDKNSYGINASDRKIYCKYCGNSVFPDGKGYLDQTNFFSPLLPKVFSRSDV